MAREEMKSEKPNLAEPVSGGVPSAARHVPTGGLEFLNSQTRSAFPPDPIHWADRASKQNMRNPMKKDEIRCRYPVGKSLPPEKGRRVAKGIIGEKERPRRRTLGSFCRNVRFTQTWSGAYESESLSSKNRRYSISLSQWGAGLCALAP